MSNLAENPANAISEALNLEQVVPVGTTVYTPLVSREAFARNVGLSYRVIEGWIQNGYLPVVKVGRYSLVNVALLSKQCMEVEGGEL